MCVCVISSEAIPSWQNITADEMYTSQLVGCLEAINTGVTTVVDFSNAINTPEHALRMIEATKLSGIRSHYCYGVSDITGIPDSNATNASDTNTTTNFQLEQLQSLTAQSNDGKLTDLITLGLSYDKIALPIQPQDDIAHQYIISLARNLSLSPITTHAVGEPFGSLGAPEGVVVRPIKIWNDLGLLGGDMLFAHANNLVDSKANGEEWELLRKFGAGVASTPVVS